MTVFVPLADCVEDGDPGVVDGADLSENSLVDDGYRIRSDNLPVSLLEDFHIRDLKVGIIVVGRISNQVRANARACLAEDIRLTSEVSTECRALGKKKTTALEKRRIQDCNGRHAR